MPALIGELQQGSIDFLEFDLVTSETLRWQNEITSFPVEDGSDRNDHIISRPKQLDLEVLFSDSHILTLLPGGSVEFALELLEALRDRNEPVDLDVYGRFYEQYAISSVSIPRDASSGDGQRVSISLQEFVVVPSQQAPPVDRGTVPTGTPSTGAQGAAG